MVKKLETNRRYVQLAFNHSSYEVKNLVPYIPRDARIIIEAGTPYIKREGIRGIQYIRKYWPGFIVADLKIIDGAKEEVSFAYHGGANGVTAMGAAPTETLNVFINFCNAYGIYSMIDMMGVENPLKRLMPLKRPPDIVIIHKGRDEEANPRTIIRYKDINKIRSKFGTFIAVAGGLIKNDVRKVYFNGGDIAILNIVKPEEQFQGLPESVNFQFVMNEILNEIGT